MGVFQGAGRDMCAYHEASVGHRKEVEDLLGGSLGWGRIHQAGQEVDLWIDICHYLKYHILTPGAT